MQRGRVATLTTQLESCTKRHLTFERHPPIFPGETFSFGSEMISRSDFIAASLYRAN